MKNVKTYNNYINESLKDKLKGKSENEMIYILNEISDSDKIIYVIKYKLSYDLLPDNLTVNGDLLCSYNQLTSLPDNLTVNGDLLCGVNKLNNLPDNLIVNSNLDCDYNNLIVRGSLYCNNNNNLTSLPDNLTINGDLWCKFNNFSNNIENPIGVDGKIYIK